MSTPPSQPNTYQHRSSPFQGYASPSVTILFTVVLLLFFFVGFFSVFVCRYLYYNLRHSLNLRRSFSSAPAGAGGVDTTGPRGLDPTVIRSFPTFAYATVKDLRREKYGLECAICLAAFLDETVLRLLTGCCHVFHQECIDLWLESHNTCPVCRRTLDSHSPEKSPSPVPEEATHEEGSDTFAIGIARDTGNETSSSSCLPSSTAEVSNRVEVEPQGLQRQRSSNNYNYNGKKDKFLRSYSTGHFAYSSRGEEDRFTLRLPEHVKLKIANQATTPGEASGSATTNSYGDDNNV